MRFHISRGRLIGGLGACVTLLAICVAQAQAGGVMYDVRVSSAQPAGVIRINAHEAVVAAVGQQVNLELWSVIANGDANQANDGFLTGQGTFISGDAAGSTRLLGNLRGGNAAGTIDKVNNLAPFDASGATSGFLNDLDGDSDLDDGMANPDNGALGQNAFFLATAGGAASLGANEQLIGTNLFIVGANVGVNRATLIDFIPRNRNVGNAALQQVHKWTSDGVANSVTGSSNLLTHQGAIIHTLVPEPATFLLFGLGGLGMFFLRRRSVA